MCGKAAHADRGIASDALEPLFEWSVVSTGRFRRMSGGAAHADSGIASDALEPLFERSVVSTGRFRRMCGGAAHADSGIASDALAHCEVEALRQRPRRRGDRDPAGETLPPRVLRERPRAGGTTDADREPALR
jgi:hypothetical protein